MNDWMSTATGPMPQLPAELQALNHWKAMYKRWQEYRIEIASGHERLTSLQVDSERAYMDMIAARNNLRELVEHQDDRT